MDIDILKGLGLVGLILLIIFIIVIEVVAVILIAGAIASWLGLSGVMWWAVALVVFLFINGVLSALGRIG